MSRYALALHALSTPREDGLLLLDRRTKEYVSLNAIGRAIVELLDEGATVDEVVTTLVEITGGDGGEIHDAVVGYVAQLLELGLLEPVEPVEPV